VGRRKKKRESERKGKKVKEEGEDKVRGRSLKRRYLSFPEGWEEEKEEGEEGGRRRTRG
jgi:hypothetical protein